MKKYIFAIAITLLVSIYYVATSDYSKSNDTLYYSGKIITMRSDAPAAEAVRVKDGRIIAVGSNVELMKDKADGTVLVDLQGKTLLPGFIDPHSHLDLGAVLYDMVDISGFTHKTPISVKQAIAAKAAATPTGTWIFCQGYDPILTKGMKSPDIKLLDSLSPANPLIIISSTLHFYFANSLAFKEAGITRDTPNPTTASYYERDAAGELSGLVVEQEAFEPFRPRLQQAVRNSFAGNTVKLMERYASHGITTMVTMGLTNSNKNILMLYEHLSGSRSAPLTNFLEFIGKLPERRPAQRHFIYLRDRDSTLLPASPNFTDDFYHIAGVKLWYDGSPYVASMYLSDPYLDSSFIKNDLHLSPGHRGEALYKDDSFYRVLERVQGKGWPIAVHCQGDQAITEVMTAFSRLNSRQPSATFRHRLEHCLLLPPQVMPAMKEVGITPSFHINHILYYADFLKTQVIGAERMERVLPIHTYQNNGLPFSLHADTPMFEDDPLSLISTAVRRQSESGMVVHREEAISVMDALKSMTLYGAWQLHMEDKLGSIEPGKYADFVILAESPLEVGPEQISRIQVLETIVAGNTIWKK